MTTRRLIVAGIAVLVLSGAVPLYLRSDIRRHNRFLTALRRSMESLPLPEGTTRLKADSRLGLLAGNGNHCDYIVAEVHATSRTRAKVVEHYSQLSIPNPEGQGCFELQIEFFVDGRPPDLEVHPPLDISVSDPTEQTKYVVFIRLIGYHDAGSDPRCH